MVLLTHIIIVTNPKKYLCEIAFLFVCSLMFVFVFALFATKHSAIAWPFFTFRSLFCGNLKFSISKEMEKRDLLSMSESYISICLLKHNWLSREKRKRKENQNNILLSVRFGIEWNIYYLLMYIGNWSWNCMCQWSFQRFPNTAECRYINTINLSHKSTMDLLFYLEWAQLFMPFDSCCCCCCYQIFLYALLIVWLHLRI